MHHYGQQQSSPVNLMPLQLNLNQQKFYKMTKYDNKDEERIDNLDIKREKQFIKNLENSFEIQYEDKHPEDVVGPQAGKVYYNHYKKIDMIQNQNTFINIQGSIQTKMLSQVEALNTLPCKIGIIKAQGNEFQLNIKNQRFGDNYASILTEGLKVNQVVRDFGLQNNRFKEKGASNLIGTIGQHARTLELQENNIGKLGVDAICQSLKIKDSKLEILNLEDNKLGDKNTQNLIKSLLDNNSLRSLNISKNFLSNDISDILKTYLSGNDHLEELYLYWNQIKGSGGINIFDGLLENDNIRVLDLSFNGLGQENPQCAQKIGDFIKTNKNIIHMDISANFLKKEQSKLISDCLRSNKTIYGFHYMGNYGYIDARGFLIVDDDVDEQQFVNNTRINGLKQVSYQGITSQEPIHIKDVCWICQGWQETHFQWIPGQSGDADQDPVFLHLQSESFKSVYMTQFEDKGIFIKLMTPPHKFKYFFTTNDEQTIDKLSPVEQTLNQTYHSTQVFDKRIDVVLESNNIKTNLKAFQVMDEVIFEPRISIHPRTPDPIYIPPKMKKVIKIWTFPVSIWAKDFKFESEDLLRKAFERDLACSKINKVIKDPEQFSQAKEVLWQAYKPIKETYKNFASYNPSGDIWSISGNPITEFCSSSELIDKNLKLSDVDFNHIATCSSSAEYKGNLRNPDRALCRFQFMEFFVRIAADKYFKTKIANNFVEAVEMMVNQCRNNMAQYDGQKWRNERYFNEGCDDVSKYYKSMLQNVYNRNSTKKVKPGQKNFMCLDELHEICNQSGFFDENFVERDANLAFNISMTFQVDELDTDRIFQMQFFEFMEATARIADKLSPIALDADMTLDWNNERRLGQPLWFKLEKTYTMIAAHCASEDFKQTLGKPKKSMFTKVEEEEE